MKPITCPTDETLKDYSTGNLNDSVATETESHVESCQRCQSRVEAFCGDEDHVVAQLRLLRHATRSASPDNIDTLTNAQAMIDTSAVEQPPLASRRHQPETVEIRSRFESGTEYELIERIGAGGMGEVWRGRHRKLDKIVAIKLIRSERSNNRDYVQRFLREMRAIGQLEHPNVVRATDAGELNATLYLVMEFVEGVDAGEVIKTRGPLPVENSIELFRQMALGLQHIHDKGILHRDIKPGNMMITKNNNVKILDAGLARWRESNGIDSKLTGAGDVIGTPDYMSPEQWTDHDQLTPASDVYSLGCTFYCLLNGHAPFETSECRSFGKKMEAHLTETAPRLDGKDVPTELVDLLARMLQKNPSDRPQSAGEVVEFLHPMDQYHGLTNLAPSEDSANGTTMHQESKTNGKPPWCNTTFLAAGFAFFFALIAIVVLIKDKDGNTLARHIVPQGGSAIVTDDQPSPAEKQTKPGPNQFESRNPTFTPRKSAHVIAFQPQNDRALIGARGGALWLVDAKNGEIREATSVVTYRNSTIDQQIIAPNPMAWWSPDGNVLAYGHYKDNRLRLFHNGFQNVSTIKLQGAPDGSQAALMGAAWDSTSEKLAVSLSVGIAIFDATGKLIHEFFEPNWNTRAVFWDQNDQLIISHTSRPSITILDPKTRQQREIELPFGNVSSIDLDKDSKRAIAVCKSDDGKQKTYIADLKTAKATLAFDQISDDIVSALWSPDGRRVALYVNRTTNAVLIYATNESLVATFVVGSIEALTWSPDGQSLVCRNQSGLKRLKVNDRELVELWTKQNQD